MSDDEFTVDELVAYCWTQARLLHGRVETLDEETAALLSEIDDDLSDVRSQLDGHAGVDRAQSPTEPDAGTSEELADLEAMEVEVTEPCSKRSRLGVMPSSRWRSSISDQPTGSGATRRRRPRP